MDRGIINAITNTYHKFADYAVIKVIVAILYSIYVFAFDHTQASGLLALLILIIVDFVTAISAAYKNHTPIKSAKVFTTAVKILIYYTLIACGHLVEKAVPLFGFMDETILAFLAVTEMISVLENCGKMGYAIPKKLLRQLEEFRDDK